MDMSQLKTQVMTMFMMKSAGGNNNIYTIVYSMLLMNFVEWVFRTAPQFISTFQASGCFRQKRAAWSPLMDKSKKDKELLNSVSMTRVFSDDNEKQDKVGNLYVEKVDAVIDFLCSLDNAKHVKMDTRYTLNSTEEMDLTPLLKARVKESSSSDDGSIMEIVVYSSVLKVSDIRNWIDEVHSNYVFEKNNKLGNRTYYFNEVPVEPIIQCEIDPTGGTKQTYRWENMPKMLMFNMNEFNTSKSFGNVYGNHVNELKERLDLFVNHPEWYMDRGIPHSLGILLHGVPGAGKTSTIKAIAKDTHRHIFNLSLRPYTSQRQLTNLFFNETVVIYGHDGAKQTLKIPMNRRVYVIEDIDCLTDVVLDRTIAGGKRSSQQQSQSQQIQQSQQSQQSQSKDGDAVTLSFLLNLLDGVLETPGRILVITSNFPDKLDKALVRPGRIDVMIEFKNTNCAFILDMINKFYSVEYTIKDIPEGLDGIFTPAEVMESMCTHFKNPDNALKHMINKIEAKLASKHGTALEWLGASPDSVLLATVPLPNDLVTVPLPEVLVPEIPVPLAEIPVPLPVAEQPKVVKNEIVLNNPKKPKQMDYSAMKAPVKMPQNNEYSWSGADFGDAQFLPGGHMPGDAGVRSPVDLNL